MGDIRIVDTTLRDGEQSAGIALGIAEKVGIAKILETMGVYQIEAGIPAMGGQEKESIIKIVELGLKSRISVWNRLNIEDIKASMSCGPVIIHICVPASDIQIQHKINRDRDWVIQTMKKCICFARERGYEIVIGLEDASRADLLFLKELIRIAEWEGVERIRYADTVGILHRKRMFDEITLLRQSTTVDFEIHAHNDLGMAVANSLAAVDAGAIYVDTTVCGIGERAGNCNMSKFIMAAKSIFNKFPEHDLWDLAHMEERVLKKMKLRGSDFSQR